MIGSAHSLAQPSVTALHRALSSFSGVETYVRMDDALGSGGLFYAAGTITALTDLIAAEPSGEPTSTGMLIDGVDAPGLVRGFGPEMLPEGSFSMVTDLDTWTGNGGGDLTADLSGETAHLTNTSQTSGYGFYKDITVEAGATYHLGYDILRTDGGSKFNAYDGAGFSGSLVSDGIVGAGKKADVVSTTGTIRIYMTVDTNGSQANYDNLSLRKVLPYPGYSTADRLGDNLSSTTSFSAEGHFSSFDGNVAVPNGTLWGCYVYEDIDVVAGTTYEFSSVGEAPQKCWAHSGSADFVLVNSPVTIASGKTKLRVARQVLPDGSDSSTGDANLHTVSVQQVFRDQTVHIEWDANSITGDRVVWQARKDANNRIVLHFVSGILRLESFVSGASEGFVAYPGVDDGGLHSAVIYWDEVAGTLSLNVDNQGLEGPELLINGGFDADIANWAVESGNTAEWEAGNLKLTNDPGDIINGASQGVSTIAGVVYSYVVDLASTTSAGRYGLSTTPNGTDVFDTSRIFSPGVGTNIVEAVGATTYVTLYNSPTGVTGGDVTQYASASLKATYTRIGLTLPTNLTEFHLGHSGGANQLNGYLLEHAAAHGDRLASWS